MTSINPAKDLPDTLSDREFLEAVASQIELLAGGVSAVNSRLDHLDEIVHVMDQRIEAVGAFIDEHRPALARGLSFLDSGAKLRGFLGNRK